MKKTFIRAFAALAAAWACMAPASAQTLYRCGPDGRDFSEKPCSDGRKVEVKTSSPSAADQAAARDVAKREARLAEKLRRENEANNKQHPVARAGAINGIPVQAPASAASRPQGKKKSAVHKKANEEKFTAIGPQATSPKKP